jgi:hypothetical protein
MKTAIIEVNNPELGKFREPPRKRVYIVLQIQPPALPYSPEREGSVLPSTCEKAGAELL